MLRITAAAGGSSLSPVQRIGPALNFHLLRQRRLVARHFDVLRLHAVFREKFVHRQPCAPVAHRFVLVSRGYVGRFCRLI